MGREQERIQRKLEENPIVEYYKVRRGTAQACSTILQARPAMMPGSGRSGLWP